MSATAPEEKAFRWLDCKHPDLLMHGAPVPFPWPADEEPPALDKDFDPQILIRGIDEYLADIAPKPDTKWEGIRTVYAELDQVIEAMQSGNLDRAEEVLRRHHALDGGSAYACFNLAFVLRQKRSLDDAIGMYRAAIAAWPELPDVWHMLGSVLEENGEEEEAAAAYERALKLKPNDRDSKEALTRLGKLCKLQRRRPDGEIEECFVTPEEMAKQVRHAIRELSKAGRLDRLERIVNDLAEMKEGELLGEAVKACRNLGAKDRRLIALSGEALRLQGRHEEARERLEKILEADDGNPWAHYFMAFALGDRGDEAGFWREIETTIRHDLNHYGALCVKFKLGEEQKDPAVLATLIEWAEANKSWRGFLLASMTAQTIGDEKQKLLLAERGYKLAPQEREMLLMYTSCLNDCEEREWVAAVIKPVLVAGKGDYQLKYVFAGALHNLGLKEEALKLVEETLAGDKEIPPYWVGAFHNTLDVWRGHTAKSEEKVLTFDGRVLKQPVVVTLHSGEHGVLVSDGVALPTERWMSFEKLSSAINCIGFQQGIENATGGAHPLGYLIVREIEPELAPKEPVKVMLRINEHLRMEGSAWQGKRRLPVEWAAYPVPAVETFKAE